MKAISVLVGICIGLAVFLSYNEAQNRENEEEFRSFIEKYNVGYGSSEEYNYRLGIFKENMKKIEELNRLNPQATFGVTGFADKTEEEMKKYMGYIPSTKEKEKDEFTKVYTYNSTEVLKAVDWSSMMTGVKDQGKCGSCWAFAAVAATEGRYHLTYLRKKYVDVPFSEQQLVDCDRGNDGCDGGNPKKAFEYYYYDGFMKSADYPYIEMKSYCKSKSWQYVDKVRGYYPLPSRDIGALVNAIQEGPVSVLVDATSFQHYTGGVITYCGTDINHAVTLVGIDSTGVYKIRNSWGPSKGERGHVRIAPGHTCGITYSASYPAF